MVEVFLLKVFTSVAEKTHKLQNSTKNMINKFKSFHLFALTRETVVLQRSSTFLYVTNLREEDNDIIGEVAIIKRTCTLNTPTRVYSMYNGSLFTVAFEECKIFFYTEPLSFEISSRSLSQM